MKSREGNIFKHLFSVSAPGLTAKIAAIFTLVYAERSLSRTAGCGKKKEPKTAIKQLSSLVFAPFPSS